MTQQPESPFEPNPPDPQVELRKNLFRAVSSFLNLVVQHLYPDDFRSAAPFIDTLRAIPALET